MPRERWSDAIKQAHFDAWIDSADILGESEKEKYVDGFAVRWGGLSAEAFKQALQHGDAEERLFALFALGYLAPPDGEKLLIPFLDSPIRKERWASASASGGWKNEQAFSLLRELLVEELEYLPPFLVAGEKPDDPRQKKAWEKELDDKDTKYVWEYDWCLMHRLKITLFLGSWGNPRAIPILVQTLQQSLALEFHSTYPNNFHIFAQTWHHFQDRLAYALGELGAWNALDTVNLPPKRLHIARRYLVFGSLHASVPQVFNFLYLANWGRDGNDISSLLARSGVDLTLGLPDLASVDQMLRERFYPGQPERLPSFHDFLEWHSERDDEWQDRWDAERNLANEAEQSDDLFLPEDNPPLP